MYMYIDIYIYIYIYVYIYIYIYRTCELTVALNLPNGSKTLPPSVYHSTPCPLFPVKNINKNGYPLDVPGQNKTLQIVKFIISRTKRVTHLGYL